MADQKDRIAFLKDALKNLATAVKEVSKGLIDLDKIIKTLKGETAQLSKNADKAAVSMGKTAEQTKKATAELKKNETQTKNNTKASKGFFAGIGKNLKTIISFYGAYQILNIAIKAFADLTIGSAKRAIALTKNENSIGWNKPGHEYAFYHPLPRTYKKQKEWYEIINKKLSEFK